MNIGTKIAKGQIEIVNDVLLIKQGLRVGTSEASLLQKLDIKPFTYGLVIHTVYDNGVVFSPDVLDMTDDDILGKFYAGVRKVACVSLAINHPTVASLPHLLIRGYKNVLAVSLATDYTIPRTEQIKKYLENPEAFAAVAVAPVAAPAAAAAAAKQDNNKKEEKKEEEKHESEEDLGLGLFD